MHIISTLEEQTNTWNEIHSLYEKILELAPHCSNQTSARILESTRYFDSIISQFEPEKDCFSSILHGNIGYIQALQQIVVWEIIEHSSTKELHRALSLFLCLTEQQFMLLKESERAK